MKKTYKTKNDFQDRDIPFPSMTLDEIRKQSEELHSRSSEFAQYKSQSLIGCLIDYFFNYKK